MKGRALSAVLLVCLVGGFGCGKAEGPAATLAPGKVWTYRVIAPPLRYVETVRALRSVPVVGANGVELVSSLGTSRLAWKDGTLYASQLGSTQYIPALPLWSKTPRKYHGRSTTLGKTVPASAQIVPESKSVRLTVNGEALRTQECAVRFTSGKDQREIRTWVHAVRGLVQQEERVNGRFRVQVQMLTDSAAPLPVLQKQEETIER